MNNTRPQRKSPRSPAEPQPQSIRRGGGRAAGGPDVTRSPRSPLLQWDGARPRHIDRVLAEQPPGLWPFLPAGYPSLQATAALLRAFARLPIRGVELGFPFSDPIADGPVIQHAFSEALAHRVRVNDVFNLAASVRREVNYPLLAMVSVSIVSRIGSRAFAQRAAAAGFDGLIVPDVSLEVAPELAEHATAAGLRLSMLIAPTTPPRRQRRIAKITRGFLYYVSVQGTTGERSALPQELKARVAALRAGTRRPVLVGFGISTPVHVRDVCSYADGAIVGSAIVRRITKSSQKHRKEAAIVKEVVEYVRSMSSA